MPLNDCDRRLYRVILLLSTLVFPLLRAGLLTVRLILYALQSFNRMGAILGGSVILNNHQCAAGVSVVCVSLADTVADCAAVESADLLSDRPSAV